MGSPLHDAGFSPFALASGSTFDPEMAQRSQQGILSAIDAYAAMKQKQDDDLALQHNEFLQNYARSVSGMGDGRLVPTPSGFHGGPDRPILYPGAADGVAPLGRTIGLDTPNRALLAPQGPALAPGESSVEIGMPTILSRSGPRPGANESPLPYEPSRYDADSPPPQHYESVVTGHIPHTNRIGDGVSDLRPVSHGPQPVLRSKSDFDLFTKMLPYGTQQSITKMQVDSSDRNHKTDAASREGQAQLVASVRLLDIANKAQMAHEAAKAKALSKGAKPDDFKNVLASADKNMASLTTALTTMQTQGFDTAPPGTAGRDLYDQTRASFQRAIVERNSVYSQFGGQKGVGVMPGGIHTLPPGRVQPTTAAERSNLSDDDLAARIAELSK